jgi:hypothetical protein
VRTLFQRLRRGHAPVLAAACALWACGAIAAPDASGRWVGSVAIPGNPLRLVIDLERDARGQWQGSAVLPDRGVKGAPLSGLAVAGCDLRFGLAAAFTGGGGAQPEVALACQPDGSLAGSFALAGNSATVSLRRSGAAQVDRVTPNSIISAALAGRWTGRYELGGYAREVTLTLANRPDTGGGGQLVVVGKRTTTLEMDRVIEGREFVTLGASAVDFRIEGRFAAAEGTIAGSVRLGGFDAPIVLHRQAAVGEKTS